MKATSRSIVYFGNIVIAILALIFAVLVVAGIVTEESVLAVGILAIAFYGAFSGVLARMNLTPDA